MTLFHRLVCRQSPDGSRRTGLAPGPDRGSARHLKKIGGTGIPFVVSKLQLFFLAWLKP